MWTFLHMTFHFVLLSVPRTAYGFVLTAYIRTSWYCLTENALDDGFEPEYPTYFWSPDRIPINISDFAYFRLFGFLLCFLSKCFLCLVFIISLLFVLDDGDWWSDWRLSRFSWRIWRLSSRLEDELLELLPEDEPLFSFWASTWSRFSIQYLVLSSKTQKSIYPSTKLWICETVETLEGQG